MTAELPQPALLPSSRGNLDRLLFLCSFLPPQQAAIRAGKAKLRSRQYRNHLQAFNLQKQLNFNMAWTGPLLGIWKKKKSFYCPPVRNCCNSYCKKLHQWQRQLGFDELEGRSRKAALGTCGGFRRVRGRIPDQLEMGERSSSLVEGSSDMQQDSVGCWEGKTAQCAGGLCAEGCVVLASGAKEISLTLLGETLKVG